MKYKDLLFPPSCPLYCEKINVRPTFKSDFDLSSLSFKIIRL